MAVAVGIRELRSNLRSFLERVKAGEEVTVTEHRRPVARIVPIEAQTTMQNLIDEGLITPARQPKSHIDLDSLPRMGGGGSLSDIVIQLRREGW